MRLAFILILLNCWAMMSFGQTIFNAKTFIINRYPIILGKISNNLEVEWIKFKDAVGSPDGTILWQLKESVVSIYSTQVLVDDHGNSYVVKN